MAAPMPTFSIYNFTNFLTADSACLKGLLSAPACDQPAINRHASKVPEIQCPGFIPSFMWRDEVGAYGGTGT